MKKVPIGIDDFKDLINGIYYFIDKSLFIKDAFSQNLGTFIKD